MFASDFGLRLSGISMIERSQCGYWLCFGQASLAGVVEPAGVQMMV